MFSYFYGHCGQIPDTTQEQLFLLAHGFTALSPWKLASYASIEYHGGDDRKQGERDRTRHNV